MTDTSPPLVPDDEQSRDRLRVLLALCCVAAVALAAVVLPALTAAGPGGSPLGSAIPQPGVDPYSEGSGGSAGGAPALEGHGAASLGALNPGDRTSVGGALADENGTSAFRSQNAEVHFTVRSSTASYWRTGAYDTYTGSGWERSGDRRPYDGSLESEGIRGERVEYEVTLNRSGTALPTVWRPAAVSGTDSVYVTDAGAFETDARVGAGTTYRGVSHRPPRDPAVLRSAGDDYPREIAERYTALPGPTQRRLGDFTANLTADADDPYETATRVESWLEANKNYSLTADSSGEDVASEFVFEMEAGYCENFATAMTAMLRSQGVPARYVVGYSTGQEIGANTYRVRGMNAHAWVEVYFPEVGWVRFDPTPGSDRLQAEQEAFENQTGEPSSEYAPTEEGSPGETFSPDEPSETTGSDPDGTTDGTESGTEGPPTDTDSPPETTDDGSGTSDDSETTPPTTEDPDGSEDDPETPPGDSENDTESEYEVDLDRDPVPGANVTATVTRGGSPAVGVPVLFNGERVGVTDERGQVTGEVPYARNLTITVGDAERTTALGVPTLDGPMSLAGPPGPKAWAAGNETNDSRSYPLDTDADLAVSGDVVTGSEVVVTATVSDVPVRNGEVRLDGERVGETDENGRIRVRLPDSPGNVTLAVERGPVAGETTVSLPNLTVSAEPTLPLALPGTGVEVRATYGDDPVPNASVQVGDAERRTDPDGTATASLPFRRSATVAVSADGQTLETTVSGLLTNLLGVLVGLAAVIGGLAYGAYRRGLTPRRLADLLVRAVTAIPRFAVALLFAVADRLERGIRTISDALRDLLAGEVTVPELFERLRAWLRERLEAVQATVNARSSLGNADDSGTSPESDEPHPEEADSYRTLREAWAEFLRVVSVRRPAGMTPGELADHAVREDDLPPEAVATLRDAFRDVEYGARSPAERLPRVEEALAAIEAAARPPEDESEDAEANAAPAGGDD